MTPNQVFAALPDLLPELQGWCELPKATILAAAALTLRPSVAVEIGVFGGKSLLPIGMMCEAIGHGRVIAIDPWSAAASCEGYEGKNAEYWSQVDHEAVYQGFVSIVNVLGLTQRIEIVRKKSDDADPPPVIDLLSIDGQHSDQAVRDVERYASKVRVGGMVFSDDDSWEGGGPAAACKLLLEMGFVPLYHCGTGTAFQRMR